MTDTLIHSEASTGWGGQEIRTLAECRWFRAQGYRVLLVAASKSKIAEQAEDDGFEVHRRRLRRRTQLQDTAYCRRLFLATRPRLVATHSNIDTRVCLAAAAMAGVPNRFRYRHVSIPVRVSPWNRLIYRRLATRIVTTAECIAEPLREDFRLPRDRVQCIFTGVDAPQFEPREAARERLAAELGLPRDSRFVGQISVLRLSKGHEHLLRAFDAIADEFPLHHLLLVGAGHGAQYLPPIAARLGCAQRVHFAGHRADPWPCYRALDACVLASVFGEGIPQAGIQSMLAATPFIGTRVGGTPEIVDHGHNGLLVDASSPEQLADALRRVLNERDLAKRLAVNGRTWAQRDASLASMGRKVEALLEPARS